MDEADLERLKHDLALNRDSQRAAHETNLETLRATNDVNLEKWRSDVRESEISWKATLDFAALAIRSLIVANGGAILALLTFLGHLLTKESDISQRASSLLGGSLESFVIGMICAVAAATVAYLAQSFFTTHRDWESNKVSRVGIFLQCLGIGFGALSLGSFSWGAWRAADALAQALSA